jgi:lysophospholipase L1-like esterase
VTRPSFALAALTLGSLLLLSVVARAQEPLEPLPAEVCLPDLDALLGDDSVNSDTIDQLQDRLERLGPACASALQLLLQERPSGQVSDLVLAVAVVWSTPEAVLPGLYDAFGAGALQPYGRRDDLVFGAARAIEAVSEPDADLLDPVRAGCCQDWLALAMERYTQEWGPELTEGGEPPERSIVLAAAEAPFERCLSGMVEPPPDPYDPLGLKEDASATLLVGSRCASMAVIEAWREVGSNQWGGQINAMVDRYNSGDLQLRAWELEGLWGQGEPGDAAATATTIPWTPSESGPLRAVVIAAAIALVLLLVLLARNERGRPWAFRIGAIGFGLSLIVVVELLCRLVGVPPGDAFRTTPSPLQTSDEASYTFRDQRFRDFQAPAPEGVARIAVVGASSIAGPGLAEQETVPGQLRSLLEDEIPCLEVVNLGHHGIASPGLRAMTLDAVGTLGSDLVVVYGGHNEVGDMREQDRYMRLRTRGYRLRASLARTRLYGLLRAVLPSPDRLLERPLEEGYNSAGWSGRYDRDFEQAVTLRFERELRDLVRAALRADSRLALAIPSFNHHGLRVPWWEPGAGPSPDRPRTTDLLEALRDGEPAAGLEMAERIIELDPDHPSAWFLLSLAREANGDVAGAEEAIWECSRRNHGGSAVVPEVARLLVELADEYGLPLIDTHAALHRASGDHLPGNDLFIDFVHLNPRGAQVVAEEMASELRRVGLVDELVGKCAPE